mgnify:CR=1 FL=1
MNNCILTAEIVTEPELRYTPNDNVPVAEMHVQFPGARDGEAPYQVKVVAWRDRATEMQQSYHKGDLVLIQGRLSMNTIDRQEGFKEKRAELIAQQILHLGALASGNGFAPAPAPTPVVVSAPQPQPTVAAPAPAPAPVYAPPAPMPATPAEAEDPLDEDDIPF